MITEEDIKQIATNIEDIDYYYDKNYIGDDGNIRRFIAVSTTRNYVIAYVESPVMSTSYGIDSATEIIRRNNIIYIRCVPKTIRDYAISEIKKKCSNFGVDDGDISEVPLFIFRNTIFPPPPTNYLEC